MSFLKIIMPFFLYNLIQTGLIILTFPLMLLYPVLARFSKKLQRWNLTDHLSERLGFIPHNTQKNTIWIHAASVGELFSAQPLIEKLKGDGKTIYVTTSSVMGRTLCIDRKIADYCSLIPCDAVPSVLMAFGHIKPEQLMIVENDLWPNLLMVSSLKRIKVTIVNGIMRDRSLHFYRMFSWFFGALWKSIDAWFVQTEGDAERFKELGVLQTKITVTGTTKSVNVVKKYQDLMPLSIAPSNRRTMIFASIHEAEVPSLIKSIVACTKINSNMLAIMVPRHKGWEKSLEIALDKNNLSWKSISESSIAAVEAERSHKSVDALIILEAGVLFKLHAYADIAFVGGTINTLGGHNITEPAVWGNAIIAGPHLENHADILPELKKHNILITSSSAEDFEQKLPTLFASPEEQKKNGTAAQKWVLNDAELVQKGLVHILKKIGS